MTTIGFTVNAVDRSTYVFEADTWRDAQNGIGRWQVLLDTSETLAATGVFNVDDPVTIQIDGATVMQGYIDDVIPYLAPRGIHTEYYRLTGRDYGMDLAQFYYIVLTMGGSISDYRNTLSGNIIRDVINNLRATFGAGIPEINPPAAGIGNTINYEWAPRTTLADGFRDIAKLDNHDFYVQDGTYNFIYFPIGAVAQHTAVNLEDIVNGTNNNILKIEVDEELGLALKNYIEAHAGSLDDHYTDLNGTDNATTGWNSANATCTVGNNYAGAPAPGPFGPAGLELLNGKTSIYCERSVDPGGNQLEMYLDFTLLTTGYNHPTGLDLHDEGHIRYLCMARDVAVAPAGNNVSVNLQDNNGNVISYFRSTAVGVPAPNDQGYTARLVNDRWYEVHAHIGEHIRIGAMGGSDYWWWKVNITGVFNWWQVERIWFSTEMASPNPSWFLIDGLRIPNVEASALAQDAGSISSYGHRMRDIYRPDIKSQFELQDFADDYRAKYKDPLESLRITATGQNTSVYAGQTLDVCAPDFGIGTAVPTYIVYRILKLHHKVFRNSEESEVPGYTFLTEYDLIKNQISGVDQQLDPPRYFTSAEPHTAWQRHIREAQRYRRREKDYKY